MLLLPELEYVKKYRIGQKVCLLSARRTVPISSQGSQRISARVSCPVFELASGERIMLADRNLKEIPAGITGVIEETDRGVRWQWHSKLAEFERSTEADPVAVADEIEDSWKGRFSFRAEESHENGQVAPGNEGLRPPQIGALYAIGSHWSVSSEEIATVVMPTGTGKTETMLCSVVHYRRGPTLVIVPNNRLRWQTFRKFRSLGLLRKLGLVDEDIHNPIVSVVTKEPNCAEDLSIFEGANVVIGVMASLGVKDVAEFRPQIAAAVKSLFVDEAHHVSSDTWSEFRSHFSRHQVVQFTATPFRLDNKLVDGRVIFSYSLAAAQRDGYFKKINFVPVFEIEPEDADQAIATAAVAALRADLRAGYTHLLMARCNRISKGEALKNIYQRLAPEMNPIVVDSDMSEAGISAALAQLRAGTSKIIVCVNMLGEGFDLPELKIAALHDIHKSLPVLLQFTGRFTRSAASNIHEATVVANIADQKVSDRLERIYSESADWNVLLSEQSSNAAKEHAELVEFLRESQSLIGEDDVAGLRISKNILRPKFSTIVYRCKSFTPKSFQNAIPPAVIVHAAWLNPKANLLFFVVRREDPVKWGRGKIVVDRLWHLFVLYHDAEAGLLHVNSSDKDSVHEDLARAVGAQERIRGEDVFRSLGRINRLIFSNIGVRKHGRRNMSFAMYTGADVRQALTQTETGDATKSNLDGRGWEAGRFVFPGCSAKGRVWERSQGSIPQLVRWCSPVGRKLIDETIDSAQILGNVLIPREVEGAFPAEGVLSVEWPPELLKVSDERVFVLKGDRQVATAFCEWTFDEEASSATELAFRLTSAIEDLNEDIRLRFDAERGYRFVGGSDLKIKNGAMERPLVDYLYDYPLVVRYLDLTELEGDILLEQNNPAEITLSERALVPWEWPADKVDITAESIWKDGAERKNSVQAYVAAHYFDEFDFIFDDDDAGEAADLICIKEEDEHINVLLLHCKFSSKPKEGGRVKDAVEVSSQAVRSAVWRGSFDRLHRHIRAREKVAGHRSSAAKRYLKGDLQRLLGIAKSAKVKRIAFDIAIVQPGIGRSRLTPDQRMVLGAAQTFLKQTVDVDLQVICSP
ncbi:DEAD/DEAH box helicase family protein [Bradyrhizobium sp. Rc3b]|uniref:DEAD/DEAH box helicase n=1 Tax=Bradyrhizobium sp. Rc3b TaxID=1855322 RepID=UPI001FCD079A|nr:DEAD/DEAH box helicase family protein [Bradyrhizobium sp. Rc3b]